jgi:hypothetical protein
MLRLRARLSALGCARRPRPRCGSFAPAEAASVGARWHVEVLVLLTMRALVCTQGERARGDAGMVLMMMSVRAAWAWLDQQPSPSGLAGPGGAVLALAGSALAASVAVPRRSCAPRSQPGALLPPSLLDLTRHASAQPLEPPLNLRCLPPSLPPSLPTGACSSLPLPPSFPLPPPLLRLAADCQKVGDQVELNVNVFARSLLQVRARARARTAGRLSPRRRLARGAARPPPRQRQRQSDHGRDLRPRLPPSPFPARGRSA